MANHKLQAHAIPKPKKILYFYCKKCNNKRIWAKSLLKRHFIGTHQILKSEDLSQYMTAVYQGDELPKKDVEKGKGSHSSETKITEPTPIGNEVTSRKNVGTTTTSGVTPNNEKIQPLEDQNEATPFVDTTMDDYHYDTDLETPADSRTKPEVGILGREKRKRISLSDNIIPKNLFNTTFTSPNDTNQSGDMDIDNTESPQSKTTRIDKFNLPKSRLEHWLVHLNWLIIRIKEENELLNTEETESINTDTEDTKLNPKKNVTEANKELWITAIEKAETDRDKKGLQHLLEHSGFIMSNGGGSLYRNDFESLLPKQWLSDSVIDYWLDIKMEKIQAHV